MTVFTNDKVINYWLEEMHFQMERRLNELNLAEAETKQENELLLKVRKTQESILYTPVEHQIILLKKILKYLNTYSYFYCGLSGNKVFFVNSVEKSMKLASEASFSATVKIITLLSFENIILTRVN